jgi:hypothetical protein
LNASAVIALGGAAAGCSYSPRSVRYRLTLYVETPEGERTGTGVVEETQRYNDGMWEGVSGVLVTTRLRGQATIVDFGARGLLFCLLIGDRTRKESPWSEPMNFAAWTYGPLYRSRIPEDAPDPAFFDLLAREKPTAEIKLSALPMLVRFRDSRDPLTVERVEPFDLAAAFGLGVKLTRATIAITDDPVTTGIEKVLPWLLAPSKFSSIYPGAWPPPIADDHLIGLTYYYFWSGFRD